MALEEQELKAELKALAAVNQGDVLIDAMMRVIHHYLVKREWQPIETAPDDKDVLVTWKSGYPVYMARKSSVYKLWKVMDMQFIDVPKYWMPLLPTTESDIGASDA